MNIDDITIPQLIDLISKKKKKNKINILKNYEYLKNYYNNTLNKDRSSFKTKNDEPTPIDCIEEMIEKIPVDLWKKESLKVLDPCCGNGNFFLPIFKKLRDEYKYKVKTIVEDIFYFNDTNKKRINNVNSVFRGNFYDLNVTNDDFMSMDDEKKYDLIVANPPYAKLLEDGSRASKNHNMIKEFIHKSLSLLNEKGYLMFITPDNWMSMADRNTLIIE